MNSHVLSLVAICLALVGFAGPGTDAATEGKKFSERAVHLDLARQMETVDFVRDYIDLIADNGYNTLNLYLEGRLATPTTQALPDEECYSAEDIRKIVEKADSRGIEVYPEVEALGHCEHFFRDGRLRHLSEERDGDGRWTQSQPTTFCPSLPESKAFLERYLAEVAAMFPESRYVAVGLDEAWHMGFCRLCAERRRTEGFGGIFAEHARFLNDVLVRLGKTMRLSDDFYEFFPERLAELPKNAFLDHWIYDTQVSRWGHRGHFAQRIRRDLLRDYAKLGLKASSMCSLYGGYDNVRALTEYSAAAGCEGMMLTQWEMTDRGHGQFVPVVVAIGGYWLDPDRHIATDFARKGLVRVFPKLTEAEADAIVPSMHVHLDLPQASVGATLNRMPRQDLLVVCEAALAAFRRSAYAPGEEISPRALSPEALADDYVCQLRLHIAKERLRLIGPALSSPRREPARVAQARKDLAEVRTELVALAARRRAQQAVWRKGCFPQRFDEPAEKAIGVADELLALGERPAADEWWCEADLSMPEFHMHPYWSILLKVDGAWKKVAGGYWKAGMRDWANFEHLVPFRMEGKPTDLRIEYHGRGPCGMNYLTVENRDRRYGPKSITKVEGLVRNPENLLVDNWKPASFGWPDTMETFHRPELQDVVSAVEFELAELTAKPSAEPAKPPFAMRAVLLDLARQMETVDFVCDYIDFLADNGYNAIQLYVEGRLKTPTTQALPDEECYSPADIRRICEKAGSRGVRVIPSVETLGHCEHFFRDGRLRHLSEERDGASRWDVHGLASTFCPSMPEAREFIARYLAEVAGLFPDSTLVGVGMDEAWQFGFCGLCAERRRKEGDGGIFAAHVAFVNDVLTRLGKTMYMDDDMYEFFPEKLSEFPKNAVLQHWNYDKCVSRWGGRGHLIQRIRRDSLRDYGKLGISAQACCATYYDYDNIRSLAEYAASAGCAGMQVTQWEMTDLGHGQFVPVFAGAGAFLRDPDRYIASDFAREGLAKAFPKLTEDERDVIVPTMHMLLGWISPSLAGTLNLQPRQDRLTSYEAAIAAFRRSSYAPGEGVAARVMSPEALADDYVCQLRTEAAKERLRLIGPALSSPRREPARVRQARRDLEQVRTELAAIAARRRAQQAVWRKGCLPQKLDEPAEKLLAVADELAALPETPAEDEWWCEVDLSMPEYHMHPFWDIFVKVDGAWKKVAGGSWKVEMWDWANFEHIEPFRLKGTPTDLRIEYHGRGPCNMTFLTVENALHRYGPKALTKVEGLVRHPENLLVDNWKVTEFGWPDTMETIARPDLQDVVSAVEFSLKELSDAERDEEPALIGQSQPTGSEPLDFLGATVVGGKDGVVYVNGTWRIPAGSREPVRMAKTVPAPLQSDGETIYVCRREQGVVRRVEETLDGLVEGPVVAHLPKFEGPFCLGIVPAGCTQGFGAKVKFAVLDTAQRRVVGISAAGDVVGTLCSYAGIDREKEVISVGFLAETGDLLLGRGTLEGVWRTHRFTADGQEVRDAIWPCATAGESYPTVNGTTWGIAWTAKSIRADSAQKALAFGTWRLYDYNSIAWTGEGYWLGTSRGAEYYDPEDLSHPVCRLGGVGDITSLALQDGRIFTTVGSRICMYWLDDRPDEPMASDGRQSYWDFGGVRREGTVTGVSKRDGCLVYGFKPVDGPAETWLFDYHITDWTHHEDRFRKLSESAPVCGISTSTEGRWSVSYDAERKAIVRRRIK